MNLNVQLIQKEVRAMDKEKCLSRISQKCDSEDSTQVERKIALYIREHMEEVLHCTLLELADQIGVSDASVVRFCILRSVLLWKLFQARSSIIRL